MWSPFNNLDNKFAFMVNFLFCRFYANLKVAYLKHDGMCFVLVLEEDFLVQVVSPRCYDAVSFDVVLG